MRYFLSAFEARIRYCSDPAEKIEPGASIVNVTEYSVLYTRSGLIDTLEGPKYFKTGFYTTPVRMSGYCSDWSNSSNETLHEKGIELCRVIG